MQGVGHFWAQVKGTQNVSGDVFAQSPDDEKSNMLERTAAKQVPQINLSCKRVQYCEGLFCALCLGSTWRLGCNVILKYGKPT